MESYARSRPHFPLVSYMATLAVALVGLGVFFMSDELFPQYKARSTAATWPETTGVVERSEVIRYPYFFPGAVNSRADILIRYQVNGVTYRINEAYFGQSKVWRDSIVAHAEARRYSVGDRVQVHHAPGDPLLATVETDFTIFTPYFAVFVLVEALALVGLCSSVAETWRYIKYNR